MFEEINLQKTLKKLHTRYVLVALNMSTKDIVLKLSNFHGSNGNVNKAAFAFYGTPLWGSYMTDVIKDYKEPDSKKVVKFLKSEEGKKFEKESCKNFGRELARLGADRATLIALGNDTDSILRQHFPEGKKKIIKIPHYGAWMSKEKYKSEVHRVLRKNSINIRSKT